ncbi:hypothetical protein L204_100806 [Cryptococcus depauperatus]
MLTPSKPKVCHTYGKAQIRPLGSSPLLSSSCRSLSPPSSYRLLSPVDDSPPPKLRTKQCTPLFLPSEDEEDAPEEALQASVQKNKPMIEQKVEKKAVQASLKGFFSPLPKKRPLHPATIIPKASLQSSILGLKRSISGITSRVEPAKTSFSLNGPKKSKSEVMTQMHLTHLPLLHTCQECGMSFVRGGQDEGIHVLHHTRVLRGIIWEGVKKGEGKDWRVIDNDVPFGQGRGSGTGKVIVVDGSYGRNKLSEVLQTVDRVLSAPPLSAAILETCKIFLFITACPPPPPKNPAKRLKLDPVVSKGGHKERVVSVVVAQGIKWGMRVIKDGDQYEGEEKLVESGGFGSVRCDPAPLPTSLGIHRLYTAPLYRSHSISLHLLNASLEHTIYGCHFDPKQGQVAFSQPTESGRRVMEKWGEGNVRVFVDDESQL